MIRLALVGVAMLSACQFAANGGQGDVAVDDDDTVVVDASPTAADSTVVEPVLGCTGLAPQQLDRTMTLEWDGKTRKARVHVPASYNPAVRTPLVLNFHGYVMDAASIATASRFEGKSNAEGFVVVHPEGLGAPLQSWNAGDCCGSSASGDVDDVGFVSALLDQLQDELCIDANRVYAAGFSNGAFLSQRLACELAPRFAAVASVSGAMGIRNCSPSRPMPIITFHGTDDAVVPINGSSLLGFRSEATSIAGWVARNGCSTSATETFNVDDAYCERHGNCVLGADVEQCTLNGGGHQWPGGNSIFGGGEVNNDLNATDAIWNFFVEHPRP